MAGGRRSTVMGEAGGPEEDEVKAAPHRLSERFCQLSGVPYGRISAARRAPPNAICWPLRETVTAQQAAAAAGAVEAEGGLEERLMTLAEFTEGHLLRSGGVAGDGAAAATQVTAAAHEDGGGMEADGGGGSATVAYLAQHPLLDQIPPL
eukprot:COSAG01_NODE_7176_length_3318_cov_5.909599_1_plen_150_part_00